MTWSGLDRKQLQGTIETGRGRQTWEREGSRGHAFHTQFCIAVLRSRSQWGFKSSGDVCPDYMLWTTQLFLMKLGMLVYHHDLECRAQSLGLLSSRSRSQCGPKFLIIIKIASSSAEPFANKLGTVVHHQEPELCDSFGLLSSRSGSQWGFKSSGNIFVWTASERWFCIFVMRNSGIWVYHHNPECLVCGLLSSRSNSQFGLKSFKKTQLSSISPELLKLLQPNMVSLFWCIITSQSVLWQFLIAVVSSRSRTQWGWNLHGMPSGQVTQRGVSWPHQATSLVISVWVMVCRPSTSCTQIWLHWNVDASSNENPFSVKIASP